MLNTCFPRTKPLRATEGETSAFALSTPSASRQRQPGPSPPLHPGKGFPAAEHSRGLWQGLLAALSPEPAGGAASLPPGCQRQRPAGSGQRPQSCTDPPGMCRGAAAPHSLNPSFVLRHSSSLQPALTLQGSPTRDSPTRDSRCVQGRCPGSCEGRAKGMCWDDQHRHRF